MIPMKGGYRMKHMMRRAHVFFIFVLILAAFGRLACAEEYRVRELSFSGTHDIKAGALKKVMETLTPSRLAWIPFVQLPPFDRNMFEDDMKAVKNYYESRGYYHTQVHPSVTMNESKKTARILIHVDEGSPTRVKGITIDAGSVPLPAGTLKAVILTKDEEFLVDKYTTSKRDLENFLMNNGYGNATVSGKVVVNKKTYTADITFIVTPGVRQQFTTVFLSGNETVRDNDILRELAFKQGDMFSQARITETQRQIFRTNLFSSVIVEPEKSEEDNDVPVSIEVEEREKHSTMLGLGYGSEDRFRVNAEWTKRYLFNSVRTLNVSFRYSSLLLSGVVNLTQPYFIDRFSSLGVNTGYQRDYLPSYSNEQVSSKVRVGRVLTDTLETYIAYNLELNRPVSVSDSLLQQLLETRTGDYYFISGLMFGIQYDTVRNKLAPTGGATCSLYIEPATFLLGSKLDYLRGIAEARVFQQLVPKYIGALRCRAGFITPSRFTRDIPVFKRFFSGGSNTVRGYSFQSLGPVDSAGSAIGGHYIFEGNIEIRYPVYKDLGGVVFMDGGNVFMNKIDYSNFDLKYGAGIGLRYSTIVGPLRVDLAFPLDPFPELAVSRYAIYFSLGNAF